MKGLILLSFFEVGAGEGNRTLVSALGRPHSTIEPHPLPTKRKATYTGFLKSRQPGFHEQKNQKGLRKIPEALDSPPHQPSQITNSRAAPRSSPECRGTRHRHSHHLHVLTTRIS